MRKGSLKEVWQNKFFKSLVPMGFFNYGGLFAIQTLWAGPWMVKVSGYTPEESANGLFIIYLSLLFSFLTWGYFVPKFSKNVSDAIRLLKFGAPIKLSSISFHNLSRTKSRSISLGTFCSKFGIFIFKSACCWNGFFTFECWKSTNIF